MYHQSRSRNTHTATTECNKNVKITWSSVYSQSIDTPNMNPSSKQLMQRSIILVRHMRAEHISREDNLIEGARHVEDLE